MDQPSGCAAEAARVDVEGCQRGLEIDEQPLAARCLRLSDRAPNHRSAYALPLMSGPSLGVNQERVVPTIPGDVDESDELTDFGAGRHPPQRVSSYAIPPAHLRFTAVGLRKLDQLGVRHRCPPLS